MVRRIRCSRAWVSTSMVTSSGMWPPSINWRTKSKSVCEADGKATSISLKPMSQSVRNMRILRSAFIGSNSAWLPSRRSVLIQTGGAVMVRLGHWRSASWTAGKGVYLVAGFFNMVVLPNRLTMTAMLRKTGRQVLAF